MTGGNEVHKVASTGPIVGANKESNEVAADQAFFWISFWCSSVSKTLCHPQNATVDYMRSLVLLPATTVCL